MKNLMMGASAAAVLVAVTPGCAQQPSLAPLAPVARPPMIVEGVPLASSAPYVQPQGPAPAAHGGGLLSKLMELERRKNAWLMRTFLGR